jgi:hypothetical protein
MQRLVTFGSSFADLKLVTRLCVRPPERTPGAPYQGIGRCDRGSPKEASTEHTRHGGEEAGTQVAAVEPTLVFHTAPSASAAPRTPPSPSPHPDSRGVDLAFAVTCSARRSVCLCVEAAGFTSCCGPRCCSPPTAFAAQGFRRHASPFGLSAPGGGLLPGAPALTRTGLSPAGSMRHSTTSSTRASTGPAAVPSRRTTTHTLARWDTNHSGRLDPQEWDTIETSLEK